MRDSHYVKMHDYHYYYNNVLMCVLASQLTTLKNREYMRRFLWSFFLRMNRSRMYKQDEITLINLLLFFVYF